MAEKQFGRISDFCGGEECFEVIVGTVNAHYLQLSLWKYVHSS